MSASEKLRALEFEIASFGYDCVNAPEIPFTQLVAVVEAAEKIRLPNPVFFPEAYAGETESFMPSCEELAAALGALNEVLR